jgi:hypothetical protein
LFNPFLAQQLGEQYMKDMLREAEQVRLIRAAKNAVLADKPASRGLVSRLQDLALALIFVNRAGHEPTETGRFAHDSGRPSGEYP